LSRTIFVPLAAALLTVTAACSGDSTTSPRATSAPRFETSFTSSTAPSGAHYRQGFSEPTCDENDAGGITCTTTAIAGVGNIDATLALSVAYSATVQCRNRGGQVVEVKTQTTASTIAPDPLTDERNGTLYVSSFSSPAPSTRDLLKSATCPNGNWTKELVGSPEVTSYTYTLTFDGFAQPAITVTG
jgi:hypothetical protein